uniref:hypothetical protein n=1 Tax=Pararhizobium sp. IMCC3301 TaxID=3067904 RepID=UPI002740DE3A|nr:hypothetical protein [Pararhizobium sp. IMCC3301]
MALPEKPKCYERIAGKAGCLSKICETAVGLFWQRRFAMSLLLAKMSSQRLENQMVSCAFAPNSDQNQTHQFNLLIESRP